MVNSNYLLPPQKVSERVINLRLLKRREIDGIHELYIFKKCIASWAKMTDYAVAKGGRCEESDLYFFLPNEAYWLDNKYKEEYGTYCSLTVANFLHTGDTEIGHCATSNECIGVRPVFSIKDIEDLNIPFKENNGKHEEYLTLEYGCYPQSYCSESEEKELDILYKKGELRKTGNFYNGEAEYILNGQRYVSAEVTNANLTKGFAWIKVEPIKWIYDNRKKILISDKIIYAGIGFDLIEYYFKVLTREMQQEVDNTKVVDKPKEEVKLLESKTGEVDKILEDIKYYLSYYHGNEDVNKIVNDLLNKYNNNLELINTSRRNKTINLEASNREVLYNNLIVKLDIILDKLKKNYEDNQKYIDMINTINCLRNLLEGTSTIEMDNDLYNDFKLISETILPFIDKKEREEIKKELLNVLDFNSRNILEFLDSIHIFSEGSIKELKYNTLNEFELSIRKDINNTLIKLGCYVNKKDLINEIIGGINDNINGIYSESKNKVVSIYLNSIYSIIESINSKINVNKEYYSYYMGEMNKILNLNLDYTLSNEELFRILMITYSKLYRLEEELDNEISVNQYKIKVIKQ